MPKISKYFLILLKGLIIAAVLYFVFMLIFNNYTELQNYDFSINLWYAISASIGLVIPSLGISIFWHLLTIRNHAQIPFGVSVLNRTVSSIGKYLPGRVFGYGYLFTIYKPYGVRGRTFFSMVLLELYLATFSALSFFSISAIFIRYGSVSDFSWIFITLTILIVIGMNPKVFNLFLKYLGKISRQTLAPIQITFKEVVCLFLGYNLIWGLYGLAFFIFAKAIFPEIDNVFYYAGIYSAAFFIGTLTFILPAGLGTRELALIFLLNGTLSQPDIIVLSVALRVWTVSVEFVIFAVALLWKLSRKYFS